MIEFHGFVLSIPYGYYNEYYPVYRVLPDRDTNDYDVCFFICNGREYQIVNRDSPVSLYLLNDSYARGKLYYGPKSRAYLVPLNPSS